MDVYRQSAAIVQQVLERRGTAKSLCLEKHVQKKKSTYAVVCETLRHYELLQDVLQTAQFFEYYPKIDKYMATVLCFDAVVGKGVMSKQDHAAVAIQDSVPYLRRAYNAAKHRHVIPPSVQEQQLPRYVRLSPLKGKSVDELMTALTTARKRPRADEEEGDNNNTNQGAVPNTNNEGPGTSGRQRRANVERPLAVSDEHIPQLVRFPPGTDLHAHPWVKAGHMVLQDKASCLPAAVLMNAVQVVRYDPDGAKIKEEFELPNWIIDGCAAPGNKTTQLAALGVEHGAKVLAVERDVSRVELLERRVKQMGAQEIVKVCHGDFCELDETVLAKAEAILLDPSCSSSGVVSRIDVVSSKSQGNNEHHRREGDGEGEEGAPKPSAAHRRVLSLAAMQKRLLRTALTSFPVCRRVLYSTCSVNQEEDEEVVREMMRDPVIAARWGLSAILPKTWATRGKLLPLTAEEEAEGLEQVPTDRCLRCDSEVDETSGFFVACFDLFPGKENEISYGADENYDEAEGADGNYDEAEGADENYDAAEEGEAEGAEGEEEGEAEGAEGEEEGEAEGAEGEEEES